MEMESSSVCQTVGGGQENPVRRITGSSAESESAGGPGIIRGMKDWIGESISIFTCHVSDLKEFSDGRGRGRTKVQAQPTR